MKTLLIISSQERVCGARNSSQEGNFKATSCNIYYCWSKQEQGGTPAVAPLVAFCRGLEL